MNIDLLERLARLRAEGLVLSREGESLRVRPSAKLTEARRLAILDQKRELLAALDAEQLAKEIITRACRNGVVR